MKKLSVRSHFSKRLELNTQSTTPRKSNNIISKSFAFDIISDIYNKDHTLLEEELNQLQILLKKKNKLHIDITRLQPKLADKIEKQASFKKFKVLEKNTEDTNNTPKCIILKQKSPLKFRRLGPTGKLIFTYSKDITPKDQINSLLSSRSKQNSHQKYHLHLCNNSPRNITPRDLTSRSFISGGTNTFEIKKTPMKVRKKLEQLDSVLYSKNTEEQGRKSNLELKRMKMNMVLEEYRQNRHKRTRELLRDIDTTDPNILPQIYDYKLQGFLNQEADSKEVMMDYKKMLQNSNRQVAKMERLGISDKKLRQIILYYRRKRKLIT